MSISQTTTTSFRVQLLQAVHNFDSDTFKIALYTGSADIGPNTTAYTTSGEASGTGYTAGGNTLTVSTTPTSGTNSYGVVTAYISFTNTEWTSASFTARGALIYNSSKSNKSVAVLDFGGDKTVTAGTFTVQFPAADANSAIVRIS
jgi:hypothetical protein